MEINSCFEVIGPVMIGPSSSHTAGPVKLARMIRALAGGFPAGVVITFHGSFAETYRGHGTDLAILGGLLGMDADDPRLRESRRIVDNERLQYLLKTENLSEASHPNTVRFDFFDLSGEKMTVLGVSSGGGAAHLSRINDYPLEIRGDLPTLVVKHEDRPGIIAGVAKELAKHGINIAFMQVYRREKRKIALMVIETDEEYHPELLVQLEKLDGVVSLRAICLHAR